MNGIISSTSSYYSHAKSLFWCCSFSLHTSPFTLILHFHSQKKRICEKANYIKQTQRASESRKREPYKEVFARHMFTRFPLRLLLSTTLEKLLFWVVCVCICACFFVRMFTIEYVLILLPLFKLMHTKTWTKTRKVKVAEG